MQKLSEHERVPALDDLSHQSEHVRNDPVLSEAIPLLDAFELTLPYPLSCLITPSRSLCGTERAQSQPGLDAALHKTMVLFYHIIEICILSEWTALGAAALVASGMPTHTPGGQIWYNTPVAPVGHRQNFARR